jgi:hypothetical protein
MALKPIKEDVVDRVTCLIIGEAGIGKTSLLRSLPEGEKACTLNGEGGLLSVRDLVKNKTVEGFNISSIPELEEALMLLGTNAEMKERYQWVFIDSLTEIADRCETEYKQRYPNKEDTYKMWGEYSDKMTVLVKAFRDLHPYNVVFTCLPTWDKDDNNKRFLAPNVAGRGLKELLPSFFDEVFYMINVQGEDGAMYRSFQTFRTAQIPAKDRSGALEAYELPNLGTIRAKILADA